MLVAASSLSLVQSCLHQPRVRTGRSLGKLASSCAHCKQTDAVETDDERKTICASDQSLSRPVKPDVCMRTLSIIPKAAIPLFSWLVSRYMAHVYLLSPGHGVFPLAIRVVHDASA